jgi:hypothetical protein
MSIVNETIGFLESTVFPQLAQQWREESISGGEEQHILPHRLPLKRRLAEFRHGLRRASAIANLSSNLWAIERFRDMTPALVIAVFEDSLVLEPGDVGPLPLHHPVARELVRCINAQQLTLPLLEKMREYGATLYDGCAVIGIVDYRRWAFGTAGGVPRSTIDPSPSPSGGGGGGNVTTTTTSPEMHKILLRPSYVTIMNDLQSVTVGMSTEEALEMEAQILVLSLSPLHFNFLEVDKSTSLLRSQSNRQSSPDGT